MNIYLVRGMMILVLAAGVTAPLLAEEKIIPIKPITLNSLGFDLVPWAENQKIFVEDNRKIYNADGLTLVGIIDGVEKEIFRAGRALPFIKNDFYPLSFDGFDVRIFKGENKLIKAVDAQDEVHDYRYEATRPNGVISLIGREEGNTVYNFNVQFEYNDRSKQVEVSRILYIVNNAYCDRGLLSVYHVPSAALDSKALKNFDGFEAFDELNKLISLIKGGQKSGEKLMPVSDESLLESALAAYRSGVKKKLKEVINFLLADGGSDDLCAPETYIAERYLFRNKIQWSNDLGFLFAEVGFYDEAITLLKSVILEKPGRAVAYLNLADAYWAKGAEDSAVENYKRYSELMLVAEATDKIPKRVKDRVTR